MGTGKDSEVLLLILLKLFKQQTRTRNIPREKPSEKVFQRFLHAFTFYFNKLND